MRSNRRALNLSAESHSSYLKQSTNNNSESSNSIITLIFDEKKKFKGSKYELKKLDELVKKCLMLERRAMKE